MPSLRQLKYAIKTVELGSINEASKHLYISQPSLSNALKSLEDELNITIFARSSKGVTLTPDGVEFISYARQIIAQVDLLDAKYRQHTSPKRLLSVSCQHYAFAVHAFAELVKSYSQNDYEFTLRETETHNILQDVATLRSEIGILYLSDFNRQVLISLIEDKQLTFTPLFTAKPHVFVGKQNPLARLPYVTLDDLSSYPRLSFEQGQGGSFYFAEEILSTLAHDKSIKVSDRATIFNLMVGVQGYTISSGVLSQELGDDSIVAVPLQLPDSLTERMTVGWLKHQQVRLSPLGLEYLTRLKQHISDYGYELTDSAK